jgi:hypothetical protein
MRLTFVAVTIGSVGAFALTHVMTRPYPTGSPQSTFRAWSPASRSTPILQVEGWAWDEPRDEHPDA